MLGKAASNTAITECEETMGKEHTSKPELTQLFGMHQFEWIADRVKVVLLSSLRPLHSKILSAGASR